MHYYLARTSAENYLDESILAVCPRIIVYLEQGIDESTPRFDSICGPEQYSGSVNNTIIDPPNFPSTGQASVPTLSE
jgi:hypothetical protein